MVFVVLFFIPVLLILVIAALMPSSAQTFAKEERVRFTHWPGRTAVVKEFFEPDKAAKAFPNGVKGAAKPPYRDGVVQARFEDLDPNGKPYPDEIAAGTSVQKIT